MRYINIAYENDIWILTTVLHEGKGKKMLDIKDHNVNQLRAFIQRERNKTNVYAY